MNLRRTLLLLVGLAAVAQWANWRAARLDATQRESVTPLRRVEPTLSGPERRASAAEGFGAAEATNLSARTRESARRYLIATYRRELFARELALEQTRYGSNYWEPGADGPALRRLEHARATLVQQLNDEANAVWREAFATPPAEPIVLGAFFDEEHPGPNVSFFGAAASERFADAIAGEPAELPDFAAIAERVLVPSDLELYRRWNAPAAIAWRERLAGFDVSEREFLALARSGALEPPAPESDAGAALGEKLGSARYDELRRGLEPAASTARGDLRRAGLPVDQARWLADARTQAIAQIQEVWQNPLLSDGAKQGQVMLIEQSFGHLISARLQRPGGWLDGLPLAP